MNIIGNFKIDTYSNSDCHLRHPGLFIIFWVFNFLNKYNVNVAKNMQIMISVADRLDARETTLFVHLCTVDCENFEFLKFEHN